MRRAILAAVLAAAVILVLAGPSYAAGRWHHNVSSTAYCGDGQTAAGPKPTVYRTVAVIPGTLSFFSVIKVVKPKRGVFGRRYWRVEDHIGAFSELDFFLPCGRMDAWGRRTVTYRVVRYG